MVTAPHATAQQLHVMLPCILRYSKAPVNRYSTQPSYHWETLDWERLLESVSFINKSNVGLKRHRPLKSTGEEPSAPRLATCEHGMPSCCLRKHRVHSFVSHSSGSLQRNMEPMMGNTTHTVHCLAWVICVLSWKFTPLVAAIGTKQSSDKLSTHRRTTLPSSFHLADTNHSEESSHVKQSRRASS